MHEHRAEFGKLGYLFESGSFDRYIGLLAARLHDCGIDEKGVHSEQDETIHKKCAADLKQVVAHYKREGMSGNELWVVAFLYRRYLDGGTDLVEIVQYYAREVLEEAAKEEPKKAD